MRFASLLVTAALALSTTACVFVEDDGPQSCTDIGCVDGAWLTVRDAAGNAVVRFHGTVHFADGRQGTFACSASGAQATGVTAACGPGWVDLEGLIDSVDIVSDEAQQVATVDLVPSRDTFQPNGPGCGPVCQQSRADVTLAPAP
jgi:hypothetical protein